MKQKKFKQEVIDIFKNFNGQAFTVGQALESYMAMPSRGHIDLKSARQFIHRNILRLVADGRLVKINAGGRRNKYLTTDKLNIRTSELNATADMKIANETARIAALEKNLTERLNCQKLQLLTAMGEAEEYDEIYKELPEMRAQLQELYNESRDRCSKLLGRVKAIENLIAMSAR